MRLAAALLVLALLCGGCLPAGDQPATPAQVTVTLSAPEAKRVQRVRELKRPAHVQRVDELISKFEHLESRESAWSRNLIILGAGFGVLAGLAVALKLMGAL